MQQPKTQKQRKEYAYPWKVSSMQEPPARYPCLYFQPLNKIWDGVDSGFTPFSHPDALHAPELLWVGPAFPPGAQLLIQAVT